MHINPQNRNAGKTNRLYSIKPIDTPQTLNAGEFATVMGNQYRAMAYGGAGNQGVERADSLTLPFQRRANFGSSQGCLSIEWQDRDQPQKLSELLPTFIRLIQPPYAHFKLI